MAKMKVYIENMGKVKELIDILNLEFDNLPESVKEKMVDIKNRIKEKEKNK